MISLAGRTALVTGGSRGIGRAVALQLADVGADVAITYLTRAADADAVAAEIRARGRRAAVFGGDLADPAACDRMGETVRRAFGRLDCFIAKPDEVVPGNNMKPYGGLASAEDRTKLIAFLQSTTD